MEVQLERAAREGHSPRHRHTVRELQLSGLATCMRSPDKGLLTERCGTLAKVWHGSRRGDPPGTPASGRGRKQGAESRRVACMKAKVKVCSPRAAPRSPALLPHKAAVGVQQLVVFDTNMLMHHVDLVEAWAREVLKERQGREAAVAGAPKTRCPHQAKLLLPQVGVR